MARPAVAVHALLGLSRRIHRTGTALTLFARNDPSRASGSCNGRAYSAVCDRPNTRAGAEGGGMACDRGQAATRMDVG